MFMGRSASRPNPLSPFPGREGGPPAAMIAIHEAGCRESPLPSQRRGWGERSWPGINQPPPKHLRASREAGKVSRAGLLYVHLGAGLFELGLGGVGLVL